MLARNLIELDATDLFARKGRRALGAVELPDHERDQIDSALRLHDALEDKIARAETALAEHALASEQVRRLMRFPASGRSPRLRSSR